MIAAVHYGRGVRQLARSKTGIPLQNKIVCAGNSLTYGTGTTTPATDAYPAQLASLITSRGYTSFQTSITNVGISGRTTAQMITDATTLVDPLRDSPTWPMNILIAWEGTNSIAQSGLTAVQAGDAMKTYCAARRALGWYVYACTMIVAGTISETVRGDYNAIIKDNAQIGVSWDGVIDIGADTRIDPTPAAGIYVDSYHITTVGQSYVADTVANAIGYSAPI